VRKKRRSPKADRRQSSTRAGGLMKEISNQDRLDLLPERTRRQFPIGGQRSDRTGDPPIIRRRPQVTLKTSVGAKRSTEDKRGEACSPQEGELEVDIILGVAQILKTLQIVAGTAEMEPDVQRACAEPHRLPVIPAAPQATSLRSAGKGQITDGPVLRFEVEVEAKQEIHLLIILL